MNEFHCVTACVCVGGGGLATETYNITRDMNECFNKIFIVFKFKYQLAILFFLLYNYMPTIHMSFCHTSKPCDN